VTRRYHRRFRLNKFRVTAAANDYTMNINLYPNTRPSNVIKDYMLYIPRSSERKKFINKAM